MHTALLLGLTTLWLMGCTTHPERTPEQKAYIKAVEEESFARGKALDSSDINESQAYLEHYPDAQYREGVVRHLARLIRLKETASNPEGEFEACRKEDSISAYESYIFNHGTEDKHYAEAFARLDELLHPGGQLAQNIHPSEPMVTTAPSPNPTPHLVKSTSIPKGW
jgi:hypothetical protein